MTRRWQLPSGPNSSQMGQLSRSGLGNRSGSAVAVRQGALQLRDLHKDTTGPGQGRGGGEGISLQHTKLVRTTSNHYPAWTCHN